jgi:hypothetical protein
MKRSTPIPLNAPPLVSPRLGIAELSSRAIVRLALIDAFEVAVLLVILMPWAGWHFAANPVATLIDEVVAGLAILKIWIAVHNVHAIDHLVHESVEDRPGHAGYCRQEAADGIIVHHDRPAFPPPGFRGTTSASGAHKICHPSFSIAWRNRIATWAGKWKRMFSPPEPKVMSI